MPDKLSSRQPQVRGAWQTALILSPRPMVLLFEVKSNLGIRYSIKMSSQNVSHTASFGVLLFLFQEETIILHKSLQLPSNYFRTIKCLMQSKAEHCLKRRESYLY